MEVRYKSLAAMDPAPWIEHFKKTAGETKILSSRPSPVLLSKKQKGKSSGGMEAQGNDTLPLTIVSPVGQSIEMAKADLNMEKDNSMLHDMQPSLGPPGQQRSQHSTAARGKKRKAGPRTSSAQTTKRSKNTKAISKLRDIFS